MRKSAHGALLVLTSIALCIASAFAAALAFGAVALVVPGTGTPDANQVGGYLENARDRFINPSGEDVCTGDGCLTGVNYPASFWPIPLPGWCPGLTCDTWNASVGKGVEHLVSAVGEAPDTGEIVIFGYSQGGAVVSRAMYLIPEKERDRIHVVTIGNINNPQGLWSRLSFLPYVPGLNISFGPQLPTNNGIKSTNYTFEYDPVGDAPLYWGNPLAVLNALAGFEYVHGYYLDPTQKSPDSTLPYGYDPATFPEVIADLPGRTYGDATFVLIPHRGPLPLFLPFVDLGQQTGTSQFIDPLVRLLNPVTKVLVDLGYDRTANPGIPRYLSILPLNPLAVNPVDLTVRIVRAIGQGIYDATHGTPLFPPNVAPSTEDTLVSARSSAEPTPALQSVNTSESEEKNESLNDSRSADVSAQPVSTPAGGLTEEGGQDLDGDIKQDDIKREDATQDDEKQDDIALDEDVKDEDSQSDNVEQDGLKEDEPKTVDDNKETVHDDGADAEPTQQDVKHDKDAGTEEKHTEPAAA